MHTDLDSQNFWKVATLKTEETKFQAKWERIQWETYGNLMISDSPSYCVQLATALDPWILWGHNGLRTRYPEPFYTYSSAGLKSVWHSTAPKDTDIELEILTIILGIPSQGSRNAFQLNDFINFFNHMYWNKIHYISGTGSVSVFWLAST
jgi:hypothetical protein